VEIDTQALDTTGDAYQAICKPVFEADLIKDAWIFKNGELTIEQVMDAPYHTWVAVQFENWLANRPWTSYNLAFEEAFLCRDPWGLPRSGLKCIMLAATPVCMVPNPYFDDHSMSYDYDIDDPDYEPMSPYKWPKLREAWAHIIGGPYPAVWHSALQDADAAARVLIKLIESGNYKLPS
jgi:hypothetical protein